MQKQHWQDWLNLILGVWLLVSRWVLDFASVAVYLLSTLIMGILIVLIASSALGEAHGGKPVAK